MNQRRTMLARTKRPLVVGAAILCFAAAGVLTPSDVRSQLDLHQHETGVEPAAGVRPPLEPVLPARDAFAPRAVVDDDPRPVLPKVTPMNVPRLPAPATLPRGVSVPATHILAIATGSHPTAIVENSGSERLVTIGDPIDGSDIATIQDDSIRLEDGRRLLLEPAAHTP
jgi:hypothetical protein